MRVSANGRMYDVRWRRIRQAANGMIIKKREKAVAVSVATNCSVSEVDETKVGAEKYSNGVVSTAYLGKKDVDNRKVARKISLAKVLQVLFPSDVVFEYSKEEGKEFEEVAEAARAKSEKNFVIRTAFWKTYKDNFKIKQNLPEK